MDKAFDGFIEWLKATIIECLDKLVQLRINELDGCLINLKEVSRLMNMSPETFRFYQHDFEELGFPKELPCKKWKKLAVLDWLADKHNK